MPFRFQQWDDFYEASFDTEVEFEEIWHDPHVVQAIPTRQNFRFEVRSKVGGEFVMRTKPDNAGQYAKIVLGAHKVNVMDELLRDANFGRKIAGMVEKYGDHLSDCQIKDPEWEGDYADDEPSCTCGFSRALSADENNTRRRES